MFVTIAAILTITGTSLVIAQVVLRVRARGCDKLRRPVVRMRTVFEDVIDRRGLDAQALGSERFRQLVTRLTDVRHEVHDDELRDAITNLLSAWRLVVTTAPLHGVASTAGQPMAADPRAQISAARDGLLTAQSVLERCNSLQRWTPGDD